MRRKDRETSREAALAVVDKCRFAVFSMIDAKGMPYCVPLSIARDGDTIYFHSAKNGQKTDCLSENPAVCISCVGNVEAMTDKFSVKYESATIFGKAREIEETDEKIRALRILSERHCPEMMHAFSKEIDMAMSRTGVWRVDIEEISGKANT